LDLGNEVEKNPARFAFWGSSSVSGHLSSVH
jgi:hypothetical protein